MECKMSFLKYRVMKRLFLFAVCAWAGLSLWASGVKGQGLLVRHGRKKYRPKCI